MGLCNLTHACTWHMHFVFLHACWIHSASTILGALFLNLNKSSACLQKVENFFQLPFMLHFTIRPSSLLFSMELSGLLMGTMWHGGLCPKCICSSSCVLQQQSHRSFGIIETKTLVEQYQGSAGWRAVGRNLLLFASMRWICSSSRTKLLGLSRQNEFSMHEETQNACVMHACMCQVTKAHEGLPHIKAICNLQYMKAKPSSILHWWEEA